MRHCHILLMVSSLHQFLLQTVITHLDNFWSHLRAQLLHSECNIYRQNIPEFPLSQY